MANPFKEAEERKRQEAEERKKREAAERAKQAEATGKNEQEQPAEPVVDAPVEKVEPAVVVPVQETVPAAPTFDPVEDAVNMLREKEDRTREKLEKKVPVNVMIPPSLKRKVEQDIRNKKVKSLSHLLTSLLEAYYK